MAGTEKLRKDRKILIRLNKTEKDYAVSAAGTENKNTSRFLRDLLYNYEEDKVAKLILRISDRNTKLFSGYKSVIDGLLKTARRLKG